MVRVTDHTYLSLFTLVGLLALVSCGSERPPAHDRDKPEAFIEALGEALQHRTLVGYGGRRFEIAFEQGKASYQREGENRWVVSIPHWQEQKDASMRYTLTVHIVKTQDRWEIVEATNLYHGTREGDGYQAEPGFKPVDVLADVKGNVYAGPMQSALRASFE